MSINKFICILAAASLCCSAAAQSPLLDAIKSAKGKTEAADTAKTATEGKKSYDKVITTEAESAKGMMNIHKVKSNYYLEIPYAVMGKPMLLSSKVSSTSDNRDVIAGQMPSDPQMIEWSCDEDNVYLLDATLKAVCDSTETIAKGFNRNYMKPVRKAFKIEAVSPDSSAVVINAGKFFCSDEDYLSPFAPASPLDALFGGAKMSGSFKSDLSQVLDFKAFPQNILVRSRMAYTVATKPFTAIMSLSMILLPDTPMRPRIADYRVGYFTDSHRIYTEKKDRSETVKYVTRWKLEPKPEDMDKFLRGELVEPQKPIVYYVDDAFPDKWRPYLKEGIEDWQKAFEAAGFKNAIIALDYPKDDPDFNPDDIRYSCLRYSSTTVANAMGPSWTDPRSGEIIQGSVYFYHDVLKLLHNWSFIQTAAVNPAARKEVYDDETMGPLLRYLVVHEIGHTLGLMHNMRASYAYPVESLRDPAFTAQYGTTPSVMDYARYNYIAQPGDGVQWLLPPRLGVYDVYAISWAYKPIPEAKTPEDERPTLNKWIMDKVDDPMYRYGEQEFLTEIDPAAQSECLGDDAVLASEYGIRNLKVIMENLVDWTAREGRDYSYTAEMYNEVGKQFQRYMGHAAKYIGGNFLEYPVYGDGKPAFTPVSRAKQKEALEFVFRSISEIESWMGDLKVLSLFEPGNITLRDLQASYISSLIYKYPKVTYTSKLSDDPYTAREYISDLYNLVFGKSISGKKINATDMNMEYAFVYSLFDLLDMLESKASTTKFADDMFREDFDNGWPCSCIECREAGNREIAAIKKESDIKIKGKEIFFSTLLDIQALMNKRANSSKGEQKEHYQFLAFEVNKALKSL
ncbi:MAG: zinc-dependent metalloprotease [Bacteroidales bacterium]|nr:zinc-dependent metalloprotease [Bacteroidales bacterium]